MTVKQGDQVLAPLWQKIGDQKVNNWMKARVDIPRSHHRDWELVITGRAIAGRAIAGGAIAGRAMLREFMSYQPAAREGN